MSERPQILLVPSWTEVQWPIKGELAEWADVASYDPPGVGDEPPRDGPILEAIVERGIAEIDRRGWTHCIVVGDDIGSVCAAVIAASRPEAVVGVALGHACLEVRRSGDRPTISPEVAAVSRRLVEIDFRAFIRQDVGIWDPRPGYAVESADELVEEMARRVPSQFALQFLDELEAATSESGASLEPFLRELGVPLLFAQHEDCAVFTRFGFEDAVAAFPDAATVTTPASPGLSAAFAQALREFADGQAVRRRPPASPG